jgi:glycosyltransferase involved in cell wall biosynthesis
MKPIISKVDCVVLPSYYREGIPRTLLEAAAMEKPIITTDNVGCKEVVEDKITGFLCHARNAIDLQEKMLRMINLTHAERIKMEKKGRIKMITEFEETIVIKKYFEEIEQIFST